MKYLVTGSPGWLGTRLVKALSGEITGFETILQSQVIEEIRCLVEPGLSTKLVEDINPLVKAFTGDICIPESLNDFFSQSRDATLIHSIGIIHPRKGIEQLTEVNVIGTKNILEAAIHNKVKRIIAVSSNSPCGVNPNNDHLFDEESHYNPYLAYGRSKMEMETLIINAYNKGDIETVILRPCWFYGPGQPERQNQFFSMIKTGNVPIVGSGENKRSMSYVDNTCQGLLLAGNNEKANGQTYWIADERPYTMNEIINTVEQLLENEFNYEVAHKRIRLPNIASKVAYGIDWTIQKFGFYNNKIHVLSEMNKTIACSIDKAKKELGYMPRINLEEGMLRSLKWMINNNIPI